MAQFRWHRFDHEGLKTRGPRGCRGFSHRQSTFRTRACTARVNTLKEHAQVNSHKHTGEAESLFRWSMTAKPPSGTARSPWQSQRFSGSEDVVNKSGESSATSGRSQACAKWSVFPVNLLFLNPVKLRTLPETRPQTSHIIQNSKSTMHQCPCVM